MMVQFSLQVGQNGRNRFTLGIAITFLFYQRVGAAARQGTKAVRVGDSGAQTVCLHTEKPLLQDPGWPASAVAHVWTRSGVYSPTIALHNTLMHAVEGTETVLVVDDEFSALSLAHAMLRRYGYTVIGANSAAEVLRLFKVWQDLDVDLALVDIVMSEMDGFELTERLRKIRPGLPVVYMSAYAENEHSIPRPAGDLPFLAKPFTAQQLAAKVRAVLDSAQTASAA